MCFCVLWRAWGGERMRVLPALAALVKRVDAFLTAPARLA